MGEIINNAVMQKAMILHTFAQDPIQYQPTAMAKPSACSAMI